MAPRLRQPIAKTIKVRSIADLIGAVDESQRILRNTGLWFRGHGRSRWRLQPSLYRGAGDRSWERTLFVRFQSSAYSRASGLPNQDDVSQWLCLMRHYGLPTRLLDWTRSPLVAAHFALRERPFRTPVIWALDSYVLNAHYSTVAPILTLRDGTPDSGLRAQLDEVLAEDEMGGSAGGDLGRSVLAVMPPEIDNRVLVQRSCFTIHGVRDPLQDLRLNAPFLVKIVVADGAAGNLARSLETMGFEDATLFPDLTHLAADLCKVYASVQRRVRS